MPAAVLLPSGQGHALLVAAAIALAGAVLALVLLPAAEPVEQPLARAESGP